MSVLTTLALMTSAVVAKLRPPVDVEITRLQTKVDDLESRLEDVNRELDQTILDLTTKRIEADRWRALVERYQGREEQQRPAGPNFGVHQITEEMRLRMQAQFQAQQLMAMAQSQQLAQQNFYGEGLPQMLGAQAQALEWCNCVPARHDMFRLG